MLYIISPTKTMKQDGKRKPESIPMFLNQTKEIVKVLQSYSQEDLQGLMKIKEPLAMRVKEQFTSIVFNQLGTSAIETYDGLQFKYMDTSTWDEVDFQYALEHVRILSGLYGIVKPLDSIYPYRLEMQTKIQVAGCKDLYMYWEECISKELQSELQTQEEPYIINLASKEYDKVIRKHIHKEQFIDIIFQIEKKGKRKVEATASKMARGAMVRFVVKYKVQRLEQLYEFCEDGYQLDHELSNSSQIVFYKVVE